MIKVVAKHLIKEGHTEDVLKVFRELVAETRKEDGCIAYGVHQKIEDPLVLTMLEEWESMEHLKAHMKTAHFVTLIPKTEAFYSAETEIDIYEPVV
ncbi:MAG: antibiotic biosynthesis monooxygenase [Clostridiales Family XIII bacterium]|jgi:quinol monooxygenase YgiN|nr:antibiotic biosynthesis monooxygenase [Clostridiales Family XIII bacterium]